MESGYGNMSAVTWNIEKRLIKDLIFNEKNPRKMSKDEAQQLQISMEKFGVCEPIVINCSGIIIGGHQRARTLRKMGQKEVNVFLPSTPLSEKEVAELTVRLNKNSGSWDFDILANHWDASDLTDWGFTLDELHLESLPCKEEDGEEVVKQKATMTITFADASHLQEAENRICSIVDEYEGAFYKVKVK